jgi:predicted DNA-binding transcriptional regulator AlpA
MDLSELQGNTLIILKAEDLQNFVENLANRFLISRSEPAKNQETEQPISQPEAIEFLGKSRQTLTSWRRKGIIQAHILGGRVYFLKSELLAAMKSKT